MKHGLLLFALIIWTAGSTLTAQTAPHICGTHGDMAAPMIERLHRNLETLQNQPITPRDIQYVPIKFHLVAKSDGTGRVAESRMLDQLCALNEDYLPLNVQFYLKNGTFNNNINNTTVYNNHVGTINGIMSLSRDNSAMNVFVLDNVDTDGGLGMTLGYYSPGKDWIVVRRDQMGSTTRTLSHEVGHFLSLLHTFNGWDGEAYDEDVHGVPAPATSPGGVPTEKVDGSNCTTAGDYICDTPPDYNFGFGWNNCNYTGGALDPMGDLVDPEERLFMSYFLQCLRTESFFSPTQQALMLADLASAQRNYITPSYVPYQVEITEAPELLAPINGEVTSGYNWVNFQWNGVGGATKYLLEIDATPQLTSSGVTRLVVSGTNKIVTNLQANKTYYWRVRPYNEFRTCAGFTAISSFKTGTVTVDAEEIKFVENWSVQPNPVSVGQQIGISVNSSKTFESSVSVLNAVGQVIYRKENVQMTAGENQFQIPALSLARGMYFIALETSDAVLTKRIVVGD